MTKTGDIDVLLSKLDQADRRELAFRWLDRALRQDLAALLGMAEKSVRARMLKEMAPLDSAQALSDANEQLQETIEEASTGWQNRVERADDEGWQQVLDALGPEQVGIWAAFLHFSQEIDEILDRLDQDDSAYEAALLARAIRTTLGQLHAGSDDPAVEFIAASIAQEEQARQRREVIELLPS